MIEQPSTYLSVRIKNHEKAGRVADYLTEMGIKVNNPCDITPPDASLDQLRTNINVACYQMIDESHSTVLVAGDGSDFGRDCAAELGYTIASKKPIYIYIDESTIKEAHTNLKKIMPIHHVDIPIDHYHNSLEFLAHAILGLVRV